MVNATEQRYWEARYERQSGVAKNVMSAYETELKIQPNLFKKLCCTPPMAFGKEKWLKFLNVDVGLEPPLPADIYRILSGPCPFQLGKTIAQTHILVLVPETINGQPLTLKLLGELVQRFLPGSQAGYYKYSYFGQYNTETLNGPSRWVLMTNDVIPGSRSVDYEAQKQLLSSTVYKVPPLIKASVAILMDYISNRKMNFNRTKDSWTYTRCQETSQLGWQMVVGGLSPAGLRILSFSSSDDDARLGLAGFREF